MPKKDDRVLALAGIAQAAECVAQLSQKGTCDEAAFNHAIQSLFEFSPEATLDVYGGKIENLEAGLKSLANLYNPQHAKTHPVTKYLLSLIALESQVKKHPEMLDVIHSRLMHIEKKREHFSSGDHDIANSLSGLYQDTLSQLKFRIIVTGNIQHLNTQAISDKIRALLLAGFRSAMLWRQLGGKKWHLIFKRSEIDRLSSQLIKQIQTQDNNA